MADLDHNPVRWRKSSRSGPNGDCVEVAILPGLVAVRDSTLRSGSVLYFRYAAWARFLAAVRAGAFERPGIRTT